MRSRMVTVERLEAVARAALIGGYGHVETWRDNGRLRRRIQLRLAMDCEAPYEAELYSRFPAVHGRRRPGYTLVIQSRCRKCRPCRERKRMFWAARAIEEWKQAPLTVFGTLTFSPENDAVIDARCRLYRDPECTVRRVENFDAFTEAEKFRERVKFAGFEVTKYLKRLRNSDRNRKIGMRYLLVAEAHASGKTSELKRGRPHFHCLIHQAEGAQLVEPHEWARKATGDVRSDKYGNPLVDDTAFLKREWKLGFSSFAMCRTPQAASYVCKYLTKEEAATRIRASFRYGATAEAARYASECESSEDSGSSEEKLISPKSGEVPTQGGKNGYVFFSQVEKSN